MTALVQLRLPHAVAAARVDVAPPNGATSALGTRRLAPRDDELDHEEPASLFV